MTPSVKKEALNRLPLFRSLPEELLESFAEVLEERFYSPGDVIFNQGDTSRVLFIVQQGEVALIAGGASKEMILAHLTAGSYLNEQLLEWERPHSFTARSVSATTLLVLSKERAEAVLSQKLHSPFTLEKFLAEQAEKLSISDSLRQALIFRNLSEEDLSSISKRMNVKHFKSGELIIRAGDSADCMYFIKSGEVRVFSEKDGQEKVLAFLKRGDPFGEMALLTSQPRVAHVRASMDCDLLILSKKDFDEIVQVSPSVLLELSRVLSLRLRQSMAAPSMKVNHRFITFLSVQRTEQSKLIGWHVCQSLARHERKVLFIDTNFGTYTLMSLLHQIGKTPAQNELSTSTGDVNYDYIQKQVVVIEGGAQILPLNEWNKNGICITQKQLVQLISFFKSKYDAVILDLGTINHPEWSVIELLKQSELDFICVDATRESVFEASKLLTELEEKGISIEKKIHIIGEMRKEDKTIPFRSMAQGLRKKAAFQIHLSQNEEARFLEKGESLFSSNPIFNEEIARIERWLTGKRIGVALGGGGSRGFAHLGVLRTLIEAGIPVDMIAGTSMGALIGAQFATGLNHEQMMKLNHEEWVRKKPLRDYIIPKTAILGGKKVWRMLERIFKDLTFEDLPIPFFAVAADLISGEEVDISEGPLVPAIRASMSLPGIGVPVMHNGQYLVDGGVINNLPADLLKRNGADIIIAVNVTPQKEDDLFGTSDNDSFIMKLIKKSAALKEFIESPSMFKILLRSLRLSTSSHIKQIVQDIDFYIRPDVRGIGLFAFDEIEEVVKRGEEAAQKMIPEIKTALDKKFAS